MRVMLACLVLLAAAVPAGAQTAATGGGTTTTGLPTSIVAPPAENLVPGTTGNIVAPPAENLVPGSRGNLVAPPAESLVTGTPGGAAATTGAGTSLGTTTGGVSTGTGLNTTGVTGLALPPAVAVQPFAGNTPTAFFGGAQGTQAALNAGAAPGVLPGGLAANGVLAPTGTSIGSRPGAPQYIGARLDPYDPDEPDALDFSRTP